MSLLLSHHTEDAIIYVAEFSRVMSLLTGMCCLLPKPSLNSTELKVGLLTLSCVLRTQIWV